MFVLSRERHNRLSRLLRKNLCSWVQTARVSRGLYLACYCLSGGPEADINHMTPDHLHTAHQGRPNPRIWKKDT